MRLTRSFASLVWPVIGVASLAGACGDSSEQSTPSVPAATSSTVLRGHDIALTTTFGPPQLAQGACDAAQHCVFPLSRANTSVSGSLRGTTVSGGVGIPQPAGGYNAVGIHLFSGTVDGCGEGTVEWTEQLFSDDKGSVTGTWAIVEGSGSGALEGMSGGGTFTAGTLDADSSGTATAEGRVVCD